MQRKDFVELFTIMKGLPVTIRLLDPPLHEFLPHTDAEMEEVAKAAGTDILKVRHRACAAARIQPDARPSRLPPRHLLPGDLRDAGARDLRGRRRGLQGAGETVIPEIMIPLIGTKKELDILKAVIDRVAGEVMTSSGRKIEYLVGTMIELPRACLQAGEIAETAEFFSFGTNDLTQTTFGISRDDAGSFLPDYQRTGILEHDPFVTIDVEGVGELVKIAAERGRATRPDIKLGICGEHGGDPASVHFCETVGLDYVSCSPYRVPIARLAAAQAALSTEQTNRD